MEIEFTFRAGKAESGSANGSDDLRSLYRHLMGDDELRRQVRVSSTPGPSEQGHLGTTETVLAVVATAAAVGDFTLSLQAWVASLRRRPSVRLEVAEEHREDAGRVYEALAGAGQGEEAEEAAARGAAPVGRIDPNESACVLIGVDHYNDKDLDSLRAVYNNLTHLRDVFTDRSIWGIKPGRLRVVRNPETPQELIQPIRQMAELAKDTLVVYYSGHGLKDFDEDELYLALPTSVPGEAETSVRYKAVKSAISQSRRALRVVVILDCCYSGRALEGGMSGAEDIRAGADIADVYGSYLMASAASNRRALAPRPDDCTVFTGALVETLRDGVPDDPSDMLSLGAVFRDVQRRLRAVNGPEPQEQVNNQVGELGFVHNRARTGPELAGQETRGRRGRRARRVLVAASIVLAVGGGLAFRPGIEWWRGRTPVPAGGACSSRATLLSVSDRLDKTQVRGEKVVGLSALALTGPSGAGALALADNTPARVFPLSLGRADSLSPEARTAVTLRRRDGSDVRPWHRRRGPGGRERHRDHPGQLGDRTVDPALPARYRRRGGRAAADS